MLTELASFDGNEIVRGELVRPDRYRHLFAALSAEGPVVPRGGGLSYCAAGAGAGCRSVSSLCFNRLLAFDEATGKLVAEPGLRVGHLLAFAAARGWYPPVLPGHPMITLGGCVAFDVHGKSHRHGGSFGDCVRALTLFHPENGEVACSREVEPELFELTVGGMGLTGFITRIDLQLEPLRGGIVERRRIPVANLGEAVTVLREQAGKVDSIYSWNDLNRRRGSFGCGIVYTESFRAGPVRPTARFRSLSPEEPPRQTRLGIYGRRFTSWLTHAYHAGERLGSRISRLDLMTAAFPINGREAYYRLFGRRGFREYQMLVPMEVWDAVAQEVERLIAAQDLAITLGSLKLFAGRPRLLRFCGTGVCLALDTPATSSALELFGALDDLLGAHGGRLNLSKDSRVSAAVAQRLFPDYEEFRDRLATYDPGRQIDSALRRRVLGAA